MARTGEYRRATEETTIQVGVDLDTGPAGRVSTGHGFLDHLLQQLQRHGRFGLDIEAEGDLEVDVHHLAEDCGITLGAAFEAALGDRYGLGRYGHALVPMDETLALAVVDLSGRPFVAFDPAGFEGSIHGFNAHHLREFVRGFANSAGVTIHIRVLSGLETHHVCEAVMKALARALHDATRMTRDDLPSTKGVL